MFIALDEALMELQDESLGARIARYRQCARIIRQGVRGFQLRTLLPDEQSSNTVTSVFLPEGISLDGFIDRLDQRGYVVYPGKRHLYQQGMFQIANMGNIKPEDCEEFLRVLKDTLRELGYDTSQVIR
jgi:2-aminoethylphosphonate-pyruvate transaminase